MKQILLICAVVLLASCSKLGVGTFSIKNEYDKELVYVSITQYDEGGSNLGKISADAVPANSTSPKFTPVYGTDKIIVTVLVSGKILPIVSNLIKLKPIGNTVLVVSNEKIVAQ